MQADPKPFTVVVSSMRDAVEICQRVSGRCNATEFRGWRPGAITLVCSAVHSPDGVVVTLNPELITEKLPVFEMGHKGGVSTFRIHESMDFDFLRSMGGYCEPSEREPTKVW